MHVVESNHLGFNRQHTRVHRTHGIDGVHDQVRMTCCIWT
jgi:hypothetical protein